MSSITYKTLSPKQTKNLAKKIAKSFKGGEILGLVGNLGTGKTQFTKGLAEYFKIKQTITSPTFVLLRPYPIPQNSPLKKIIHIDCYRLDNPQALFAIGIEEYLNNPNYITVIEWAQKIKQILPKNTIWIKFEIGKKENERIIEINK